MSDNTLYLYTSLTAGSSHIVTATARLETILKANKLPFQAIDVATDDHARKLWGRRSRGRKLPGLVKSGMIVGDLEQIEDWNEFGELRMQVNNVQALDSFEDAVGETPGSSAAGTPATENVPATQSTTQPPAAPKQSTIKIQNPPSRQNSKDGSISLAMRQASEEAASKAKENKTNPSNKPTSTPATTDTATTSDSASASGSGSGAGPTELSTTASTAPTAEQGGESVRRKSIIGEIAGEVKRPQLVPENAAVSSANLHADNPKALREHHRTSIVSATSHEEREKVARDLRKSISGGNEEMLESLRKSHNHTGGDKDKDKDGQEVRTIETIPQDPFENE